MNRRAAKLAWLLALPLSGCYSDGYFEPVRRVRPAEPSLKPRTIRFVYPADAPIAGADDVRRLLRAYRRQGKTVVVDAWSVRVPTSRLRFERLIELHERHHDQGLQCLALCFDNPGQWQSEIAPFLRSVRCTYPCLMIPPSTRGDVIAELGYQWDGRVPALLVFDPGGDLAAELIGAAPARDVEEIITPLLAGRKPPGPEPQPPSGVSLKTRLLGLGDGKPLTRSDSTWPSMDNEQAMARKIAQEIETSVDWSNARVAVLPITVLKGQGGKNRGRDLAVEIAKLLQAKHPQSVVDPNEVDTVLNRLNLTPLGIEFDSSVLAGKVDWTHIISGTLRGR